MNRGGTLYIYRRFTPVYRYTSHHERGLCIPTSYTHLTSRYIAGKLATSEVALYPPPIHTWYTCFPWGHEFNTTSKGLNSHQDTCTEKKYNKHVYFKKQTNLPLFFDSQEIITSTRIQNCSIFSIQYDFHCMKTLFLSEHLLNLSKGLDYIKNNIHYTYRLIFIYHITFMKDIQRL